MIHFNIQGRRTGKTHTCIERMRAFPEKIMIVHSRQMRSLYPEDVINRVFTIQQLLDDPNILEAARMRHRLKELIIDEGLIIDPVIMAKIYYKLGELGYDVEVWGSLPGATKTYPIVDRRKEDIL